MRRISMSESEIEMTIILTSKELMRLQSLRTSLAQLGAATFKDYVGKESYTALTDLLYIVSVG